MAPVPKTCVNAGKGAETPAATAAAEVICELKRLRPAALNGSRLAGRLR